MNTLFHRPNILFSSTVRNKYIHHILLRLGCNLNYLRLINAYTVIEIDTQYVIYEKVSYQDSYTTCKRWKLFGKKLHRENGPAIIVANASFVWYWFGKLHRTDGPAVTRFRDGKIFTELWFNNDELHRDDGPAIKHYDGTRDDEYWMEGRPYDSLP